MSNAHPQLFGRGRVHLTPPLSPTGTVNAAAYGAMWGSNAGAVAGLYSPGVLRMPPGRFVGNTKGVAVAVSMDTLSTPDYTNAGYGADTDILTGVQLTMSMYGFGVRNVVDMLRGARTQTVGGVVTETFPTGETSIEADSMIFAASAIDLTQPIILTPSWTDWTENVHWAREAFGIRMITGFAGPVGSTLSLTYTSDGGGDTVEVLTQQQVEVGIVYAGINLADRRPIRADFYRALVKPVDGLELIGDGYAELKMTFTLQPVRIPGQQPRWFRILRGDTPNV